MLTSVSIKAAHTESQRIGCILDVKVGYTTGERQLQIHILESFLCFGVGGHSPVCLIEKADVHVYGEPRGIVIFYLCLKMLRADAAAFCSIPS
jgi:hypothetical protein